MIYTISTIMPVSKAEHKSGRKLVLVTGFFDLLHAEHINFLQKAKAAGDVLIIAVESDERARILKGEGRPVETQTTRLKHLEPYGDYLIALDEKFNNLVAFESLIKTVSPNILAVSSHTTHQDKKAVMVSKYGGELRVVHSHNPNISTSKLLAQNHV